MSLIEYVDNFEEVDMAFAEKISGHTIDGKEIPIVYYSPDVDLQNLREPSFIMYRLPPFPDNSRWRQDPVIDNERYVDGVLTGVDQRKPPEPYAILYTIRTLYEYQTDGIAMNRFLYRTFNRNTTLDIKGIAYDVNLADARLTGSGYKDFGKTDEGDKQLGETFTYRVNILLDVHDREETTVAQSVEISTTTKKPKK
jgi:hypothetical protein